MWCRNLTLVMLLSFGSFVFAIEGDSVVGNAALPGPYATSLYEGGKLFSINNDDENFPVSLMLEYFTDAEGKVKTQIDRYSIEGGDPKVESVLFFPMQGEENVWITVSWEINSRGEGTYGTFYQVYAYQKNQENKLVANDTILLRDDLRGMDGYQGGHPIMFKYKSESEIKKLIAETFKPPAN